MKIRCDRSEIVEKLGVIAGIVPSNSPKPILYDFLLRSEEGSLRVEANDLEVAGSIRIDQVEVMDDGRLALPAARLLSILREIPDRLAGVYLEKSPETNGAVLRAEGYEFKLLGHDPEEFPGIGEIRAERSLEVLRDPFTQSLRRVAIAVSRDPTRYQLQGVFFEVRGGKLTLTATDGKRLTNDELALPVSVSSPLGPPEGTVGRGAGVDEISAIVPSRAVDAILKMLGSPAAGGLDERFTLGFTDTDVVVKTAASQLNAKLIEGTYPNYRNALPQNASIKVKIRRSELLSAARNAQLMTDTATSTVIFRFEESGLTIWSQAKDIGETRIQIPAEVEHGPLEIRFNPSYFIDALRCIDEEEVRLEFSSGERPGVLRGGAHYRHMIMPLVLEQR